MKKETRNKLWIVTIYAIAMGFLEAVGPQISVIMCGKDNQYGHPHSETLQRLEAIGTKIYRTDKHGNIIINSNGKEFTVTTNKK